MIQELDKTKYKRLNIGFKASEIRHPEILSVIQKNNPGRIFVDDIDKPLSALVWSYGIFGFYLIGLCNNHSFIEGLEQYIKSVILPQIKDKGYDTLEISGNSKRWDNIIQNISIKNEINKSEQLIYKMKNHFITNEILSTDSSTVIRKVNRSFIYDSSFTNKEFVLTKIDQFWDCKENYLNKGIGFTTVKNKEITSLCISGFVANNTHAIDIETSQKYRNHNHGRMVCNAFLTECNKRKFIPHWECMANNIPSRKLAEKIGFKENEKYNLYQYRLINSNI